MQGMLWRQPSEAFTMWKPTPLDQGQFVGPLPRYWGLTNCQLRQHSMTGGYDGHILYSTKDSREVQPWGIYVRGVRLPLQTL